MKEHLKKTLNTLNYMLCRHSYNKEQEQCLLFCSMLVEKELEGKKEYVAPESRIANSCLKTNVVMTSGYTPDKHKSGCGCGCQYADPTHEGCFGCPMCNHDNSYNHSCN